MKMDKDTFAKHNFWFLLLLAAPLALLAIVLLMTVVVGQIAADRNILEKMVKDAKGVDTSKFKTPSEIALKRKLAKLTEAEKDKIWGKAYKVQEPIFDWMASLNDRFQNGLFALKIKASEKPPGRSAEDTKNVFHGKMIEDAQSDSILVEGEKGKTKKFYKTEHTLKVDLDGKKTFFQFLKKGYHVSVTYEKGKFFGDVFTREEQDLFVDGYADQIFDVLKMVNPVNAEGKGTVIFRNWLVPEDKQLPPANASFFRYVSQPWEKGVYDEVDIWAAQENLWVQREIFRIIAEANRRISDFQMTKSDDKTKVYYFENPYWALRVKQESDTQLKVGLANRMNRYQRLGIQFKITTDYKDKEKNERVVQTITIPGSLIAPAKKGVQGYQYSEASIKLEKPAAGIFGVEQNLSWKLAAVKRIDQIAIGVHSHRTASEPLVAFRSTDEKKDQKAAPVNPFGGGLNPPGVPAPGKQPGEVIPGQDGGPQGGKVENPFTKMGLLKNRYLKVSDQSRRIPVGVSLIVDQRHIDLVATAFRNSKLRFLTTQVTMHQYPYELSPTIASNPLPQNVGNDPNNPGFNPGFQQPGELPPGILPPGIAPPGVLPPGIPPPGVIVPMPQEGNDAGGGVQPMPMFPGPGQPRPALPYSFSDEQDPNVELVIYGIISLYQRFPPRDKSLLPAPAEQAQNLAPPAGF